jgi:hypothetical protein
MEATLADLQQRDAAARIWAKDPSLWKAEPDHQKIIRNSLGWLTVMATIRQHAAHLAKLAVEVGRPLTGATFKDVQEITAACARSGCVFEPNNPLTALMDDTSRGTFRPDILEERMLSVLVEMTVPQERLPRLLDSLKNVSLRLPTVFSLGLCQAVGSGGEMPMLDILEAQGIAVRPNGKINLGLGRMLPPPPAHKREE